MSKDVPSVKQMLECVGMWMPWHGRDGKGWVQLLAGEFKTSSPVQVYVRLFELDDWVHVRLFEREDLGSPREFWTSSSCIDWSHAVHGEPVTHSVLPLPPREGK